MKVLVACEFSGKVRDAFRVRGHDAWSCDILPGDGDTRFHIQGDVTPILKADWDLIIAHPPCTYLCNSGVRWLHEREGRWELMREGAAFFKMFMGAAPRVAIENPVMHRYALEIVGRKPNFTVQPWQFGDDFKKRTCFWTEGLPTLVPTSELDGSTARADVHLASPGPDRWKIRSVTYQGIADAMADQWGK